MRNLLIILFFSFFNCNAQINSDRIVFIRVIDFDDSQAISNAEVEIYSNAGSMEKFISDSDGMVSYHINSQLRYKALAYKEEFLSASGEISQGSSIDTLVIALKYAVCTGFNLPEFRFKRNSYLIKDAEMLYSLPDTHGLYHSFVFEIVGYSSLDEDSSLAFKRAQSVMKELVRLGLPDSLLAIVIPPNKYPVFPTRESLIYKGKTYLFKENTSITHSDYMSFDNQKRELIDMLMRRTQMSLVRK